MTTTSTAPSLLRNVGWKLLLSLLLGGLFAWLVSAGGVPLLPPAELLRAIGWQPVLLYAAIVLVTHVFRASRWRHLIAPVQRVSLKETILLNWIGFFAIFILPLRLGELARPALTKARQGIPISVGMGTVAVERVVDGMVTSLCVAWALFALPRLETDDPVAKLLPFYGVLALLLFGSAFVALFLFLWQRQLATALVERCVGWFSAPLGARVASKVAGVADGLRSVAHGSLLTRFLIETLLYWGLNAFGMWQLGHACGVPMSYGQAVGLMGVLAIGILLPAGPGLFGNFQLAVSTGLKLYFATAIVVSEGALYVFLLYTVQSAVLILTGVVPLYFLKIPFSALLKLPQESNVTPGDVSS